MIFYKPASRKNSLNVSHIKDGTWWQTKAQQGAEMVGGFYYNDFSGSRMGSNDSSVNTAFISGKLYIGVPMGGFWVRDDIGNVKRVDPLLPVFENEGELEKYLQEKLEDEKRSEIERRKMSCCAIQFYGKNE